MVYHSKKASFHNKNEKKEDVGSSNRRKVVGLDDFAHRKATGKAIAAFRDRKEQKRLQRAQGLRQYKKVLKAEGYQVETGNLRKKRKKENDNETSTEEKETSVAVEQQQQQNFSSSRKRHHKTVPFVKDIQKAKEAKALEQKNYKDKETQEKERRKKLRERRQRTAMLRQRTSKGQPVMKNLVHDILAKLEKEKQAK